MLSSVHLTYANSSVAAWEKEEKQKQVLTTYSTLLSMNNICHSASGAAATESAVSSVNPSASSTVSQLTKHDSGFNIHIILLHDVKTQAKTSSPTQLNKWQLDQYYRKSCLAVDFFEVIHIHVFYILSDLWGLAKGMFYCIPVPPYKKKKSFRSLLCVQCSSILQIWEEKNTHREKTRNIFNDPTKSGVCNETQTQSRNMNTEDGSIRVCQMKAYLVHCYNIF